MANNTIKMNNNTMMVTFAEKKGAPVQNYNMYTEGIKALAEIGRVATLKVVEAVTRVNNGSLWKLGNSEKTGLPYGSINEWAIAEFGYSKSHVSEMLSVSKQCCDPETGIPLDTLSGYSYTQLLAFTKNPTLLAKAKVGECPEDIGLWSTAKEIKTYGMQKAIEGKEEDKSDATDGQNEETANGGNKDNTNGKGKESGDKPSESRTLTINMADFERWYNLLSEGLTEELLREWDNVLGNPFS